MRGKLHELQCQPWPRCFDAPGSGRLRSTARRRIPQTRTRVQRRASVQTPPPTDAAFRESPAVPLRRIPREPPKSRGTGTKRLELRNLSGRSLKCKTSQADLPARTPPGTNVRKLFL